MTHVRSRSKVLESCPRGAPIAQDWWNNALERNASELAEAAVKHLCDFNGSNYPLDYKLLERVPKEDLIRFVSHSRMRARHISLTVVSDGSLGAAERAQILKHSAVI